MTVQMAAVKVFWDIGSSLMVGGMSGHLVRNLTSQLINENPRTIAGSGLLMIARPTYRVNLGRTCGFFRSCGKKREKRFGSRKDSPRALPLRGECLIGQLSNSWLNLLALEVQAATNRHPTPADLPPSQGNLRIGIEGTDVGPCCGRVLSWIGYGTVVRMSRVAGPSVARH